MTPRRPILASFILIGILTGGLTFAAETDQEFFLEQGATRLSVPQLKKLFSGSRFVARDYSVRNLRGGVRIFESRGYSIQLRWWIDGRGRFCTDTRNGAELCDVDYFLHENQLKIFTRSGATAKEFTVEKN